MLSPEGLEVSFDEPASKGREQKIQIIQLIMEKIYMAIYFSRCTIADNNTIS